ncbi:MAG: hypothetical protein ISR24_07220 [Candidatus Poseidonia sp.]|nr:hypothetical protein [Poseidonia sp.]
MEADTPWDDIPSENEAKDDSESMGSQPVIVGQLEPSSPEPTPMTGAPTDFGPMLTGTTELPPGQMIYLQGAPSGAAKIVGILVVIYGVFGIGSAALNMLTTMGMGSSQMLFLALDGVAIGVSIATIVGGVMLTRYERRAIPLLIIAIFVSTIAGGVQLSMVDTIYEEMLENGDLTQDEYDLVMENNGLVQGIGLFFVAFCGGFCALIVAIPLMVSNNGLDNSKLFG